MHAWLQKVWYENAPSGFWLRPLSWLFGALAAARRGLYAAGIFRSHSVGRPVIVVGNLTAGGTGKTPLTLWLATRLRERGLKVGIVLRGYQGRNAQPRLVTAGSRSGEVGDEALLLARRSGAEVAIGADRVAAALLLAARGVDLILSDDGLQHLRLRRDLEIVVIDGARGFGNGRLLPAGPLREPVSRLSTVDAVVINGAPGFAADRAEIPAGPASPPSGISMSLQPREAQPVAGGPARPLDDFKGQKVHALAAIGNPERFFRLLESRGIALIRHALPDHHPLRRDDIEFGDDLPVLMTEKDAVKCGTFADTRHWYVPVEAVFAERDARALLDRSMERVRAFSLRHF